MARYQALHPEMEFNVRWKPFLLYPTLRKSEKRGLYEKTMPPERYALFTNRITQASRTHNINFSLAGTTGPSQPSHALLSHILQTLGAAAQGAAVEAIYKGQFEDGRDVSDVEFLAEVGRAAGLQEEVARRVVRDENAWRMVEEDVARAAREGVEAVPCVTVVGRLRVGGYQEGGIFEEVFEKVRREKCD
ncbi:Fc.00g039010.m01.CDS01 [Cosmosporella sp. VM-42]